MNDNFIKVTRSNRCQICGKPDWCLVSKDGGAAICPRVPEGAIKYVDKTGFLHRLKDVNYATGYTRQVASTAVPKEEPTIDAAALMEEFRDDVDEVAFERLAAALGVTDAALQFLGTGWCDKSNAWAFPMSDAAGNCVGIRLRSDTGKKWAVRGSRNGLFLPAVLTGEGPLFVVEGPTDTAALIDLDVDVIGLPCNVVVGMLVDFLRTCKRDVVIVQERDDKIDDTERCQYCKVNMCPRCRPGKYGAQHVIAPQISGYARTIKIISPLDGKDSREWKKNGLTKETLLWAAKQVPYWRAA